MARSAVLRAYPKAADAEDWHLKVREASANLKSALRAAQKARKKLERAYEIVDALPLGLPFADLQSIPVARSTDVFNLIKNFQSLEEALLPTEEEDRNLFSTMFSLRSWLVGGLPSRTKNRRSHTQLKIGQRKTSVTSSEQQGGTLASAVPIRPQS
jgi:hypothetical protein